MWLHQPTYCVWPWKHLNTSSCGMPSSLYLTLRPISSICSSKWARPPHPSGARHSSKETYAHTEHGTIRGETRIDTQLQNSKANTPLITGLCTRTPRHEGFENKRHIKDMRSHVHKLKNENTHPCSRSIFANCRILDCTESVLKLMNECTRKDYM